MDYLYINSNESLAQFCETIKSADYCTIDTEFIREKTYYPILALIQIASDDQMACVDPLVIDDFTPLQQLLSNTDMLKVFHSPSQDLEILYQKFGEVPTPVFDTQLAASVLGFSHQVSYADLVNQITGVQLEKKHTRADWSRRPLSEDELNYAMDDVRYLLPVYQHLKNELDSRNRFSWIEKDLADMTQLSNYEVNLSALWKRLKGVQKLKGVSLLIASRLCEWRELQAQQKNLPRRWVAKDDVLIEIARQKPQSAEELGSIRELNEKFLQRHAAALLDIVQQALQSESASWPRHENFMKLSPGEQALGDCLMALCRNIAEQNDIAVASLATRKDIDSLIVNRKNSRLAQGWQFDMAGEQLLDFIHGQLVIGVDNSGIRLLPASR